MAVKAPSWEAWQAGMTHTPSGSAPSSRMRRDYYDNFVREIENAPNDDYAWQVIEEHSLGKRPAAAPKPAAPKKSVLAPQAPPPAPLDQKVTQKERDEITKPAKGLETTIKTSPTLLREKRRKSYLTSGG